MQYNSALKDATFLKKSLGLLVEVNLPNKKKTMLRCPYLGNLPQCEILGTRVWYSQPIGLQSLPALELAEVDAGHLVAVNQELIKPLFKEAVKGSVIKELMGFKPFTGIAAKNVVKESLILLNHGYQYCYVGIAQVATMLPEAAGSERSGSISSTNVDLMKILDNLIRTRQEGLRAILFLCVTHSGVENVVLDVAVTPENTKELTAAASWQQACSNKIAEALQHGVEVLAYKANVSCERIHLTESLPVHSHHNSLAILSSNFTHQFRHQIPRQ
jgi:sugar fermentation stimulation protein A